MSSYTPGPWVYALEYGPNVTESPRITTVARCANFVIGLQSEYAGGNYRDGDPSGDEEADARLIAVAPEQHEALQATQLLLERLGLDSSDEYQCNAYVIAKATGESK